MVKLRRGKEVTIVETGFVAVAVILDDVVLGAEVRMKVVHGRVKPTRADRGSRGGMLNLLVYPFLKKSTVMIECIGA